MDDAGSAESEDGRSHLDARNTAAEFRVYKRRWFILFVLCLLNCSNAMVGCYRLHIHLHRLICAQFNGARYFKNIGCLPYFSLKCYVFFVK